MIADAATRDPLVLEMQKALPFGVWAAYRTRYQWQPAFDGFEHPDRIGHVEYLNGENDYFELPLDPAVQKSPRAVPISILLFATEGGSRRNVHVDFAEAEMLSLFPRLGRGDTPLELVFQRAPSGRVQMLLRNARESVRLEHAKIESFLD